MAGFLGEKEVLTRERVKQILRNKQYSYLEEKVSLLEVRTDSLLLKISFLSEYHKRMISIEAKEPIVIPLKDFKIEDWGDGPDVQVTGRCLRGNEQYKRCLGVKRYRLPMLAWEGGTSTVTRIRGRIFELLYDRCLLCIFDFLFLSVKRSAGKYLFLPECLHAQSTGRRPFWTKRSVVPVVYPARELSISQHK